MAIVCDGGRYVAAEATVIFSRHARRRIDVRDTSRQKIADSIASMWGLPRGIHNLQFGFVEVVAEFKDPREIVVITAIRTDRKRRKVEN